MQHRTSHSRTRHRRVQWETVASALTLCADLIYEKGILGHSAFQCGYHRGRVVLPSMGGDV